jgi:hypothetical protein
MMASESEFIILKRKYETACATLAHISLMLCRCVDNGKPCAGCTRAGREAPTLAYQTLRALDPDEESMKKFVLSLMAPSPLN